MTDDRPFWQRKSLEEMTREEWESLCDGCGKCCLIKLQDEDTEELAFTDVVCHLFDCETCLCTDYKNRTVRVPDCIEVTPENAGALQWMPPSCAYRLLAEGEDLAWWHPLVSGDRRTVEQAGMSAKDRVILEGEVEMDELEDRIVAWPWLPAS